MNCTDDLPEGRRLNKHSQAPMVESSLIMVLDVQVNELLSPRLALNFQSEVAQRMRNC